MNLDKQPKERLGTLEAIVGGFILSVLLSFFFFFFIHDWAVLFFFVFLAAYLAYNLYNPKPKRSDALNMVAYEIQTSARKDSVLANADKKQKYNIHITWVTYKESVIEEIKKITENKDEYLLIKV